MNNTRLKRHNLYGKLFNECNVNTLRYICRRNGTKRWYNLKKHELICSIIVNYCALVITRLFRKKEIYEDRWCPISLIPVCDISDPYIHDNVVFSRQYIIDYFKHSVNFINPSTTRELEFNDIKRLNCPQLEEVFKNRVNLRDKIVQDLYTFSYLEDELEETLHIIVDLNIRRNNRNPHVFREARIKFHKIWLNLIEIDKNRTACIIRSLMHKCQHIYKFSAMGINSSMNILAKYLSESEY